MISAHANWGSVTLASGYTYYWTSGSCQSYMNNKLQPAQDIYYCYEYNNYTSCPSCYAHVLIWSTQVAGIVNYLAWNCQGSSGHNGGSCHFYDSTDICASLFAHLLGSTGLTTNHVHSLHPGPGCLIVWPRWSGI
jgi:hypothetical protein